MADRSVVVRLRAEIGQYKQAMTEAAKSTQGVGKEGEKASRQGKDFVENWSKAATPVLAVGGAITALGVSMLKTGISYNQLQQQSRAALTTILGSTKAANEQMDKLDAFARTSPFSKSTFISAQQQMLAFGIETKKVIPYLDAIQDAVAASGGGNADIAGVVATMSKIQSSAKLTAEDLNELGNRGINAAELIGSQMGMTGAEVRESITAGSLDAGAALDALAAGMEQRFDGAADNVKNTFTGALDRVSAAWRDLSSELAEPLVGKEGGGLFTGLLNGSADFLRDVQALPGPVKGTAAALTGLTGVAALGAGAFLTFAPRVVATRKAISELGPGAQRAYAATSRLGRGAAGAAAGLTALSIAGSLFNDSSTSGIESWTKSILEGKGAVDQMSKGNSDGWFFGMGAEGLAGTIQDAEKATGAVQKFLGVINLNPRERGANEVKAYDAALAKLVSEGNLEEAAQGAELFASEAERGGVKADKAEKMLSQYRDALDGLDNSQKLATEGAKGHTEAQKEAAEAQKKVLEAAQGQAESFITLGESLNDSKVSLGDWIKELEQNAKALEAFTSNAAKALNRGLDESMVDAFKEAGPEGARRLAELADASEKEIDRANKAWRGGGRNVEDYVNILAKIEPEVITQFKTAGAPGAIKTAFKVAEAANLNKREVRTILEALDYSSDDINRVLKLMNRADKAEATVELRARDAATSAIEAARRALQSLDGDHATVRIDTIRGGKTTPSANGNLFDNGRVRKFADGGIDEFGRPVQRHPQIRSGSQGTVMWGEPETGWEAYISGKPGKKDRNRAIASEAVGRLGGNVQWFADGGMTEAVSAREFTGLRIRVRDLQRALRETEKYGKGGKRSRLALRGLDRLEARQELAEARAELAEQRKIRRSIGKGKKYRTAGQYNRAIENRETASSFAADFDSDAFRSPVSLERALATKLRESAEFTQTLAALKKKGASKWLIEQLIAAGPSRATNRTAKALLTDTDQLKRLNAMSAQLDSTSAAYAVVASGGNLTAAQSRALSGAAGVGVVNLSASSVQQVAAAIVTGSRNVSVRTVNNREYENASMARFPSPLAGVFP